MPGGDSRNRRRLNKGAGEHAHLLANEKELAMGRAINAELRKQSAPVDDVRLNAFVTAIAAQFQNYYELPLSVEVTSNLEKRDVSALPGGFLRIPLGAVLQAETETQLAFAIAHAVAHLPSVTMVANRSSVRRRFR
jgi:predicted Zn-dependent protease